MQAIFYLLESHFPSRPKAGLPLGSLAVPCGRAAAWILGGLTKWANYTTIYQAPSHNPENNDEPNNEPKMNST